MGDEDGIDVIICDQRKERFKTLRALPIKSDRLDSLEIQFRRLPPEPLHQAGIIVVVVVEHCDLPGAKNSACVVGQACPLEIVPADMAPSPRRIGANRRVR